MHAFIKTKEYCINIQHTIKSLPRIKIIKIFQFIDIKRLF